MVFGLPTGSTPFTPSTHWSPWQISRRGMRCNLIGHVLAERREGVLLVGLHHRERHLQSMELELKVLGLTVLLQKLDLSSTQLKGSGEREEGSNLANEVSLYNHVYILYPYCTISVFSFPCLISDCMYSVQSGPLFQILI